MVFESRVGETFVLGASIVAHRGDHARPRARVAGARASRARCRSGRATAPAAPLELGLRDRRAGARAARAAAAGGASTRLTREHDLDRARRREPPRSTCATSRRRRAPCPTTARSSSSACRDELGDWRVCVLSPRGGRIHAPWAMAVAAQHPRGDAAIDVETHVGRRRVRGAVSGRRGAARRRGCCCPIPTRSRTLVVRAARRDGALRREVPRERRARAAAAAAAARASARRSGSSASAPPICWRSPRATARSRCCSRPTASACATSSTCRRSSTLLRQVAQRASSASSTVDSDTPSPFAASLLFSYVANFIYDGDAPLAERRAQALVRRSGAAARAARRRGAARAARPRRASTSSSGSCSASTRPAAREQRRRRARPAAARRRSDARPRSRARAPTRPRTRAALAGARCGERRVVAVPHRAATTRFVAVEDAARYRDALGVPLPRGLPEALLRAGARPARRSRAALRAHARAVHAPATSRARYGLGAGAGRGRAAASSPSAEPPGRRRVPARRHAARVVRRRACCACCGGDRWRGCAARSSRSSRPCWRASSSSGRASQSGTASARGGPDALLDAIEQLQGAPFPPAMLETRDPAGAHRRLRPGRPRRALRGGRSRLGRASSRSASATAASRCTWPTRCRLLHAPRPAPPEGELHEALRAHLRAARRRFFADLHDGRGGGWRDRCRRRAVGPRLGGRGHQRHPARCAPSCARRARHARGPPALRRAFRSRRAGRRPAPRDAGRWSTAARAGRSALATVRTKAARPSSSSRATACSRGRR